MQQCDRKARKGDVPNKEIRYLFRRHSHLHIHSFSFDVIHLIDQKLQFNVIKINYINKNNNNKTPVMNSEREMSVCLFIFWDSNLQKSSAA